MGSFPRGSGHLPHGKNNHTNPQNPILNLELKDLILVTFFYGTHKELENTSYLLQILNTFWKELLVNQADLCFSSILDV